MNLGEQFPDDLKKEFAGRSVKIGSVIKLHVYDTTPPKEKRVVLMGRSFDKFSFASIYINTDPPPKYLLKQHEFFDSTGRDYLDHDSYIDCSDLHIIDARALILHVEQNPGTVLGELEDQDYKTLREKIKTAKTISNDDKKKFGLFL